MKGPTHGAIVAGVSSGIVATWSRKKALERYDPNKEPPTYTERLEDGAAIIAKGIAFTGLTWVVAKKFDTIEATILADSYSGHTARINSKTHHNLHSLPYLGPIFGAAKLIKNNSVDFGDWIARKLNIPDRAEAIANSLQEFADWLLNYPAMGAVGHIIGDIPNKGHGGTALKLLRPIIDTNFALGLVRSSAQPLNKYLFAAGAGLAGASWTITAAYLLSWKPPESKIKGYLNELREYSNLQDVIMHILSDIEAIFSKIFNFGKKSVFSLPVFKQSPEDIRENPFQNWFELDISPNIFGITSFSVDSLRKQEILPRDFSSRLETSSLYKQNQIWPTCNGTPLVVSNRAVSEDTRSLFAEAKEAQSISLMTEDVPQSTTTIYNGDNSDPDQDDFTSRM